MSLVDDILTILSSYPAGYKLMRKRIYGLPDWPAGSSLKELKEQSLRVTLSRLKSNGLIENKNLTWRITGKGKSYLKDKIVSKFPHFRPSKTAEKLKGEKMVIVFDIPEKKKRYRDWLRGELITLRFTPLQKSVWFGPAPLPKEFIDYLSESGTLSYLKFFKIRKEDIVSG